MAGESGPAGGATLRSARELAAELARESIRRRVAVFLDYDGTLTPIVARPDLAVMSPTMRAIVAGLARRCPVAIISGRDVDDVRAMVGIETLCYAGSHGFDIHGPGIRRTIGDEFQERVREAAELLRGRLDGIEGLLIETKRFGVAVHYRLVAAARVRDIERTVDDVARSVGRLRKKDGKKVFELQPAIAWDKGRAVLAVLDALGLERDRSLPIYIGDDVTDEDAFRALQGSGVGIVVWDGPRPTAATHFLESPAAVEAFLAELTDILAREGR
jgi:trehalose-phosphatase